MVEKKRILDGRRIRPGDAIIGLPGDGLHTNGYSLARDILFNKMGLAPDARVAGLAQDLGEELLRVHPELPAHAGRAAGRGLERRRAHHRRRARR